MSWEQYDGKHDMFKLPGRLSNCLRSPKIASGPTELNNVYTQSERHLRHACCKQPPNLQREGNTSSYISEDDRETELDVNYFELCVREMHEIHSTDHTYFDQ